MKKIVIVIFFLLFGVFHSCMKQNEPRSGYNGNGSEKDARQVILTIGANHH